MACVREADEITAKLLKLGQADAKIIADNLKKNYESCRRTGPAIKRRACATKPTGPMAA